MSQKTIPTFISTKVHEIEWYRKIQDIGLANGISELLFSSENNRYVRSCLYIPDCINESDHGNSENTTGRHLAPSTGRPF
ncbi:hypothetical protein J6590_075197 [Homalodisca vitripennis]|nr:hypothetical protein J6590_075197 [Homalodisca vitripennis]